MSKRSRRRSSPRAFLNWKRSEWRLVFALFAALTLFGLLHRSGSNRVVEVPVGESANQMTNVTKNRNYLSRGFGVARQSYQRPIR